MPSRLPTSYTSHLTTPLWKPGYLSTGNIHVVTPFCLSFSRGFLLSNATTSSFGILEEVFSWDFWTAPFFQNYFVREDEFRLTLFSRNYFSFSISYLLQLQSLQWAVIMTVYGNPSKTLIIIINIWFSAVQFLLQCTTICYSRVQCPVLINTKSRKAMRKKAITKLELPWLFTGLIILKFFYCACVSSQVWFWSWRNVDNFFKHVDRWYLVFLVPGFVAHL